MLTLAFLRDEFRRIQYEVQQVRPEALSSVVRDTYHEELMRLLFTTDTLEDLQEPYLGERRQIVRNAQALQNMLKPGC